MDIPEISIVKCTESSVDALSISRTWSSDLRRGSAALSIEAQQRLTAKVLDARKSSVHVPSLDALQSATVKCMERRMSVPFKARQTDDILTAKVRRLAYIVQRLLEEFDLFKNMESSVLESVSHIVHYTSMRAGQLVFKQGDPASFCYIILSGEVTVWVEQTALEKRRMKLKKAIDAAREMDEASKGDGKKIEQKAPSSTSRDGAEERPNLVPTSLLAREKCFSLAISLQNHKHCCPTDFGSESFREDSRLKASNFPVAALGPGCVFGELALVNGEPRSATISCWSDCEFLIIKKEDFDAVVKADLKREKDRKVQFLQSAVPGMRDLPREAVEKVSCYFKKMEVPRNHTFFEQGQELNGSIYFISRGTAESYQYDADGGFTRRPSMLNGSVFAAVPRGTAATCSVVSTSSTCEVLHVSAEDKLHLPDVVLRKLREVLEETASRRKNQCLPLSPMGKTGTTFYTTNKLQANRQFLPRLVKVPRPLAGKFPPTHRRAKLSDPFITRHKADPMRVTLPSFSGLFKAQSHEVDYEIFELHPGETIASCGVKPKRRQQGVMKSDMLESFSLPALR